MASVFVDVFGVDRETAWKIADWQTSEDFHHGENLLVTASDVVAYVSADVGGTSEYRSPAAQDADMPVGSYRMTIGTTDVEDPRLVEFRESVDFDVVLVEAPVSQDELVAAAEAEADTIGEDESVQTDSYTGEVTVVPRPQLPELSCPGPNTAYPTGDFGEGGRGWFMEGSTWWDSSCDGNGFVYICNSAPMVRFDGVYGTATAGHCIQDTISGLTGLEGEVPNFREYGAANSYITGAPTHYASLNPYWRADSDDSYDIGVLTRMWYGQGGSTPQALRSRFWDYNPGQWEYVSKWSLSPRADNAAVCAQGGDPESTGSDRQTQRCAIVREPTSTEQGIPNVYSHWTYFDGLNGGGAFPGQSGSVVHAGSVVYGILTNGSNDRGTYFRSSRIDYILTFFGGSSDSGVICASGTGIQACDPS